MVRHNPTDKAAEIFQNCDLLLQCQQKLSACKDFPMHQHLERPVKPEKTQDPSSFYNKDFKKYPIISFSNNITELATVERKTLPSNQYLNKAKTVLDFICVHFFQSTNWKSNFPVQIYISIHLSLTTSRCLVNRSPYLDKASVIFQIVCYCRACKNKS